MARSVLGAGLLVASLTGCGLSWSADDSGRLQDGIDELVSVGGPDGQKATRVTVSDCGDEVEMPMGSAQFTFDGPDDERDADAANAELARLSAWYGARWEKLGWEVDDREFGSAYKQIDGKRMRAAVDAVTSTGYSVHVVRDGAGLCS